MKTRFIGKLEVSPIGMGCMGFSHGYGPAPEEGYSLEAIRKAYGFGCTLFDTAEGYGREQFWPGHNEQLVGKALKSFRNHVVLSTKLHIHPEETAGSSVYEAVRRHLEQSMKNLRTDFIDLYYLHRINENVALEDIAYAMGRLIDEGLIRGWGLSQVDADTLDSAHKITPVTAVQNLYNMLERDCETDIFPYCLAHNIGVVPFSPIASGFLSGKLTVNSRFGTQDDVRNWVPQLKKENIAANQPILDILTRYSAEKNVTPAQICLAWMLHKYPNAVPIPGSKNQERIQENLGSWDVQLTDAEFASLEQTLNACTVYGHRGHVETEGSGFSRNWRKQGGS